MKRFRYTKIVFTVGPATESEQKLEALLRQGADICRINMAHADHEWTLNLIQRLRKVCHHVGRHIPIMMDIKGPEIRTGDLEQTYDLEEGELFDFVCVPESSKHEDPDIRHVSVNYKELNEDVNVGDTVLVDSGLIRLEVTQIFEDRVRGKVIIPGPLGNRRHINLPGVKVRLPCLTEKDMQDITTGVEGEVDFFALSFVRQAEDIRILRKHLDSLGSKAKIIAKIEDQTAVSKLQSIINACDGLMIARGDLGIECPYEQLPSIQRHAVKLSTNMGKPVIVATHMLESMIENPLPTRAEISDVSNAINEQADCIMLSGETTTGKYPVECINAMHRIAMETEKHIPKSYNSERVLSKPRVKLLRSAAALAHELDDAALLIWTSSGELPQILSSLRPVGCRIFAFTNDTMLHRQLNILWGVEAFLTSEDPSQKPDIEAAIQKLITSHRVQKEQWLVVISNSENDNESVDNIQMRQARKPQE